LRLKSSSDAWKAPIAASMSALARVTCVSRVDLRSTSIRSMFCLAAFKPLIAAISACARLGLALVSNSSMRTFAA
jgi:hypothetical protein